MPPDTANCPVNLPTEALAVLDRLWKSSKRFASRNHFLLSVIAVGAASLCQSSSVEFQKICREYGRPIAVGSVAVVLLVALGLAEINNAKHYERGFRSARRSLRVRESNFFAEV